MRYQADFFWHDETGRQLTCAGFNRFTEEVRMFLKKYKLSTKDIISAINMDKDISVKGLLLKELGEI